MTAARPGLLAALTVPFMAAGAAGASVPLPAEPVASGPLTRVTAPDASACSAQPETAVCRWGFELSPAVTGDVAKRWYATVGAVTVTPPAGSCLVAVTVTAEYPLAPGVTQSLIARTNPPLSRLHVDFGGWASVSLNVDALGAATPPGSLSELVRGAPGALAKWVAVVPTQDPGAPPGSRMLDVVTQWSGRSDRALQLATAEEENSDRGFVLGTVSVRQVTQNGPCSLVAPAGPGFYAAAARPVARRGQPNCILVRAPDPAHVVWSISGPGYDSPDTQTALAPVAGYGRACLPVRLLTAGRYVAHVQLRGGKATRRYDVAFRVR